MSDVDFADMTRLTDALYRAEQVRMQTLAQEETRLRQALAKLEEGRKAALALSPDAVQTQRLIGADLLWQGWVARIRAELNRQLALVLAQKARQMSALHRAHGRYKATQALQEAGRKTRDQMQTRRDQTLEQSLIFLKTVRG
mgnify:CR=1 FL=1